MTIEPALENDSATPGNAAPRPAGLVRRIGARVLHDARQAVAPTLFFFIGFNFIVLTSHLLVAHYVVALSSFMLATVAALVVGKAVLVANSLPFIRHYDRAPLIQPILYKTVVYWIIVFLARLLERFVHFAVLEHHSPADFFPYLFFMFSWHQFVAVSLWIFVLFLVYVTATEFTRLFGPDEIRRLLFTRRPSELQLNRRQRIRELLSLSRLADEYRLDDFRDPTSAAHQELLDIIRRLTR